MVDMSDTWGKKQFSLGFTRQSAVATVAAVAALGTWPTGDDNTAPCSVVNLITKKVGN